MNGSNLLWPLSWRASAFYCRSYGELYKVPVFEREGGGVGAHVLNSSQLQSHVTSQGMKKSFQ